MIPTPKGGKAQFASDAMHPQSTRESSTGDSMRLATVPNL